MKLKTALFIGRFQPFHLGHLGVLKQIALSPDIGRILIGIGSSQEARTPANPFTFHERELMIDASIKKIIKKPRRIFGIQDMHHRELWWQMVQLTARENFDVVYSNNDWTISIMEANGVPVRRPSTQIYISGTQIRELIKTSQKYAHLIPASVFKIINSIGDIKCLKKL